MIEPTFLQKRCLVTGAAVFIGSHLCDRLLVSSHIVTGLDNLIVECKANLKLALKNNNFTFIESDIIEINPSFLTDIEWVFHLAGLYVKEYSTLAGCPHLNS